MTPSEILLAVIRGDSPLSTLRAAGIAITRERAVRSAGIETVRPTVSDLQSGWKRHAGRRSLRKWALLILHADCIEIEPAPGSPEWDTILGSIWDAAGVP